MEKVIILEEVTSTNEYLKQYYRQLPDETVVLAKRQTQGKGRQNRTWKSEVGNVYMSILKKGIKRDLIFQELMNVSVSIVRLLKNLNIKATIKYPNDILVNTKKISGILMESSGYHTLDYLVIGIGLNVGQTDFKELSHKATSILNETGTEVEVKAVADTLLSILQEDKDVYKEYIVHSYVIGKQMYHQGKPYIVTGVNLDGSIQLRGQKEINIPLNEISLEEFYE